MPNLTLEPGFNIPNAANPERVESAVAILLDSARQYPVETRSILTSPAIVHKTTYETAPDGTLTQRIGHAVCVLLRESKDGLHLDFGPHTSEILERPEVRHSFALLAADPPEKEDSIWRETPYSEWALHQNGRARLSAWCDIIAAQHNQPAA